MENNQGLGMIFINVVGDNGISLNSKTMEHYEALHAWLNGEGPEVKIIKKGLSMHSLARKYVIKISFTLYAD